MNDFIVNDDQQEAGKAEAKTKRGMLPSVVIIYAAPVWCLAWLLLDLVAPQTFAALGGWVTVVVVLLVAGLVAVALTVRRFTAGAIRVDKNGKEIEKDRKDKA